MMKGNPSMKSRPVLAFAAILSVSGLALALSQPASEAPASTRPLTDKSQQPGENKPAGDAPASAPVSEAAATAAARPHSADKTPPAETYESFDGKTKLPVLARREVTLVIEDLVVGTGKECPPGATVEINYHGQLTNGKVFDTTREKQPVTFPLGRLVQGWQIGIPGMKVGGTRRLTVPPELGYGAREIPGPDGKPLIPAGSTLVFTIELKDLK
jgi:FKBP-type peptidyl-prolyl cis-trans isomerase